MRLPRLLIGTKFALVLVAFVPALAAIGLIANHSLGQMNADTRSLYTDNVKTLELVTSLSESLDRTANLALRLIPTVSRPNQARINVELDQQIMLDQERIQALRLKEADDPAARASVDRIAIDFQRFVNLRRTGALDKIGFDRTFVVGNERLAERVSDMFQSLSASTSQLTQLKVKKASEASDRADATYRESRLTLLIIALLALCTGIASMLVLVRNVVPRIRSYASFAADVSSGNLARRLEPRGRDEIADLGRALDAMVAQRQEQEERADAQSEFNQMAQLAEAEEEAYDLLKRQLERSVPASTAVVLNRNNSDDRLQAMTTVDPESILLERLAHAEPRSCLAIRFGRMHREGPDRTPLVSCEVCGAGGFSTCEPLLVGGEVIGAALVQHPELLAEQEYVALTASVSQAAPVLGNLRNLALAEVRAATDALTGLPNTRDAHDTLKRMIAQALRTMSPLGALLLDLDHFKQINDTFGHGRGDDVLASVGTVLRSSLREGDFVARFGGEEFLVLLPDTGRSGAMLVAEKVRAEIELLTVAGVSRDISVSIGVAVIPDDAADGVSLLRYADRALYSAKAHGRNRVEAAEAAPLEPTESTSLVS